MGRVRQVVGVAADVLRPLRRMLTSAAASGPRDFLDAERARWFFWLPVAFGAGIAAYFALHFEPSVLACGALVLMALGVRLSAVRGFWGPLAASTLLAIALGLAVAKARTEWVRAPVLDRQLRGVEVRGVVELVEPRAGRGLRITLAVTQIQGLEAGATPRRVRIKAMGATEGIRPGHSIRIRATLSPPPPPALPGGYDFGRTAWYLGLGATGYALGKAEVVGEGRAGVLAWTSNRLQLLRQEIGARIVRAVPGENGAIATSLITGERGGISEATTDAFRDSGLIHILSISGLHMVIMAGAVFAGLRLLFSLWPAVALYYPIKKWAALAALLSAWAYLLISGSSIATVRAFLMIAIMFLAVLVDRPALTMRNVALSALVILVLLPESLLDAGFQMSFAAVVSLVSAYEAIRSRERDAGEGEGLLQGAAAFLGGIVLSTLIASIAVAPFGAYHFHRSQQYALIANVIAVPICNLIVMPAGLATLILMPLGLEALPLWVMDWGIGAMVKTAAWVASLPGAVVQIPAMSTSAFGLMICGGLWLTLWRARWRFLGLAFIGSGLVLARETEHPDILVGFGGDLVAVRQVDGQFNVLALRLHDFELSRWLEHDGDGRPAALVRKTARFRCDGEGCVTRDIAGAPGATLAVARGSAALRDDCGRATILIARGPRPEACRSPRLVIDGPALQSKGVHAISVSEARAEDGSATTFTIATVEETRGRRPWSEHAQRQARNQVTRRSQYGSNRPSPQDERAGVIASESAPPERAPLTRGSAREPAEVDAALGLSGDDGP